MTGYTGESAQWNSREQSQANLDLHDWLRAGS